MPSVNSQAGLLWKENLWGDLEPEWTAKPDINIIARIARRELHVSQSVACEVNFLASGAFNKVYTIQIGEDMEHIMRVSLPVQPHLKTMSETATITYVLHHTDIPAPKVWASDPSHQNELGFEWMIQDFVHGRNLAEAWKTVSWLKKEVLVRKIISYFVQLFNKRFGRLGNIYSTKDLQQLPTADLADSKLLGAEYSSETEDFCQGRIVSMPFFWGKHVSCDVARGPFTNSRDWMAAQLQLHLFDLEEESDPDADSESDSEDVHNTDEAVKRRADRLMAVLAKFFPEDEAEEFVLHHHDLNQGNILLDSEDNLAGIIDWECVHTVPLYQACQMPKFLDASMGRSVCPDAAKYGRDTLDDGTVVMNDMYYEHLEEYQNQCLWEFFLQEMGRQCPEWITWHKLGKLKSGLEDCVTSFGTSFGSRDIDEWLDNVEEKGKSRSLQEIRRVRQHYLNNPDGYRSPPDSDAECVSEAGAQSDHESAWETASDSSSGSN